MNDSPYLRITTVVDGPERPAHHRPIWRSIRRGLSSRCPHCGQGHLFYRFLKSVDQCARCGEDMSHQRADDLPPYLIVLIVGHLVVGGFMVTEMVWALGPWQQLALWTPVMLVLAALLMQPVKGAVIGLQWALRMHGFDEDQGADDALVVTKVSNKPAAASAKGNA